MLSRISEESGRGDLARRFPDCRAKSTHGGGIGRLDRWERDCARKVVEVETESWYRTRWMYRLSIGLIQRVHMIVYDGILSKVDF